MISGLEPVHKRADVLPMESWDAWEAEIQERLAELTNEQSSRKPVRKPTWARLVLAVVRAAAGVTVSAHR
jgi:hypothetical protein